MIKELSDEESEVWKKFNKIPLVKQVFGSFEFGDIVFLPKFKNKIGMIDDRQINHSDKNKKTYSIHLNGLCWVPEENVIWIPPMHDYLKPERCLWWLSKEIRFDLSSLTKTIFILLSNPNIILAKYIIEYNEKKD